MKNSLILVLVAVVIIVSGAWYSKSKQVKQDNQTQISSSSTSTDAKEVAVEIKDSAFNPNTLTVKVDDMIVFTNNDGIDHTVTNEVGDIKFDFDVSAGQSANLKLSTPGTYEYHCKIHPEMTGTIIVQ